MSQKAWMQAYTKGSKSLQARLAKIHGNNPEFQEFVKKHGFGGNLSKKQSELQKKPSVATVKPTSAPSPESNPNMSREAMIKAAAEKIRNRRQANANRVAFGAELGGGFQLPGGGFRRYSESWDESKYKWSEQSTEWKEKVAKEKKKEAMRKAFPRKTSFAQALRKKANEEVNFKDASYTMRRGGWVVKRNGKIMSAVLPTEKHAQEFINSTRMTLGRKLATVVRKKAKEIARGMGRTSMATESAANRRRIMSPDSAVLKPREEKPPFTPDKPKKNIGVVVGKNPAGYSKARHLARIGLKQQIQRDKINQTIDYISNPRYSMLNKHTLDRLLKGIKGN